MRFDEADAWRLSFPDRVVTEFTLQAYSVSLITDGMFVDGVGLKEVPCEIRLSTATKITARTYRDDQWGIREGEHVTLKDVCEWEVVGGDIRLAGFDVASRWTEVLVPAFSANIEVG